MTHDPQGNIVLDETDQARLAELIRWANRQIATPGAFTVEAIRLFVRDLARELSDG
jgi:hypothetical protein